MSGFDPDWRPPTDLLADRVIAVTGAGTGIGRAAANAFAAHGATVLLFGRTEAKLMAVYDEIVAAGHPEPVIQAVNLAGLTAEDGQQLAAAIDDGFGRLDGLLHNASILGPRVPLASYDAHQWHEVLATNLSSNFVLTQALLPLLEAGGAYTRDSAGGSTEEYSRESDAGRSASPADDGQSTRAPLVLFTGSGAGLRPRAYWGAYAVAKAGVEALMKVFADEADQISAVRFASLNPGGTRTAMRAAAFPGEDPASLPTPSDLMPLYLWLFGLGAREVNGQSIEARTWLGLA
ncbi:MAG: SDR family NAD(P)-dependent oxidoreductase [Gammaproteobacteria bacterium]|nr:MAG: SDR family NAD(P)-dependent oxidoreductase [Gammaproteobacteria bacterium]